MTLELDHIVVAAPDLEQAMQTYRELGYTVLRGGVHLNRATENALVTFADGTYLELLARTGEAPLPGLIDFSPMVDGYGPLPGFALRSDDLEAEAARLRASGFTLGELIPGERRRKDGTLVQWKQGLLDSGFYPFLIQDVTPRDWRITTDPAATTHPNGARGVTGITIAVRWLSASTDRYTRLLGKPVETVGWLTLAEVPTLDRPEKLTAFRTNERPPT